MHALFALSDTRSISAPMCARIMVSCIKFLKDATSNSPTLVFMALSTTAFEVSCFNAFSKAREVSNDGFVEEDGRGSFEVVLFAPTPLSCDRGGMLEGPGGLPYI